jgi:hypothetical protein
VPDQAARARPSATDSQADWEAAWEAAWEAVIRRGINITLFVRGAPHVLRETPGRWAWIHPN